MRGGRARAARAGLVEAGHGYQFLSELNAGTSPSFGKIRTEFRFTSVDTRRAAARCRDRGWDELT